MRWMVFVMGVGLSACQGNTIELDSGGAGTEANDDGGTTLGSNDDDDDVVVDTGPVDDGPDADDGPVTTTTPQPDTDGPVVSGPPEGRYLLVGDFIVQPGLPLQWEVNITRDPDSFNGQSLSLSQGSSTEPRELIGGVWPATMTLSGAELTVVIPPLQILGEANPITGGEVISGEIVLNGRGGPDGFYCGTLDGDLAEPVALPLTGSTFALIPVGPGEAWPLDFPLGC
ncbi:MAG: hypothetical protein AAF721_19990 [Myxococcota bacterium]